MLSSCWSLRAGFTIPSVHRSEFRRMALATTLGAGKSLELEDRLSAHASESFYDFLAESFKLEKMAFVDGANEQCCSFQEAKEVAAQLCSALKAQVVLLAGKSSIYFPPLFLGVNASGAICSPVKTPMEARLAAELCKPSCIVATSDSMLPDLQELGLPVFLALPSNYGGGVQVSADSAEMMEHLVHSQLIKEDAGSILLTSGTTTGVPKALTLSNKQMKASVLQQALHWQQAPELNRISLAAMYRGDTVMLAPWHAVPESINLDKVLPEDVTHFYTTPSVIRAVLRGTTNISSAALHQVICGGAVLPRVHAEDMSRLLPKQAFLSLSYGMTEAAAISTRKRGEPLHSVGSLLPGMEAKLQDLDNSKFAGLSIRGPNVSGMEDEMLYTGDIAAIKDGCLYILGRASEIIRTLDGKEFLSSELEDLLLRLPFIDDAAVYEKDGRVSCLVVSGSEKGVKARLLEAHLEVAKVTIVTEIPKSEAGKIKRAEILKNY